MKKSKLQKLAEKLEAENERLRDRLYGCTEEQLEQSFEDCCGSTKKPIATGKEKIK